MRRLRRRPRPLRRRPPEPVKKAEFSLPPPSTPKTLALPDFIEKNFISSREGHKESSIGCSGVGQSIVWQVRQPWPDRSHPGADAMLYVIGGEGTLSLDGRDSTLAAGSFAVVPRGTELRIHAPREEPADRPRVPGRRALRGGLRNRNHEDRRVRRTHEVARS